jgi:GDPmannose 4,6-dehydratase
LITILGYSTQKLGKGSHFLKRVLITGGKGQDGTLLRQLLEHEGIEVFSFGRPPENRGLMPGGAPLANNSFEFNVDLSNFHNCLNSVGSLNPDTIFHLAAIHAPGHVMGSAAWTSNHELTYKTHVTITKNLINAIIETNIKSQLIVAGSSRMYTPLDTTLFVNESTATNPIDYYGATKVLAWDTLIAERNRTGLTLKMAILFNHESKLRKEGYLFRDLAKQIKLFESGKQDHIEVRDPEFRGDWHSAHDTVEGLRLLATQEKTTDLVLASGKLMSVSDIVSNYFAVYLPNRSPRVISKVTGDHQKNQLSVVGDIGLAENLGWRPSHTLTNVLREMVLTEE